MATVTFTSEQVARAYLDMTFPVTAVCRFETEMVGGQPGGELGVRHFVGHHLKLEGAEAEAAVQRILHEEVGERDTTPEGGELKEQKVYQVNVIRRDQIGPWVGDWMVKACVKCAASKLGIFKAKLGTKGAVAEMGRVDAWGISRLGNRERIYVLEETYVADNDGGPLLDYRPAETYFREFPGHVSTPQGMRSILTHAECLPPGGRFAFQLRMPEFGKMMTDEEILNVIAAAGNIGLGSCKAFERGKFAVESLTIERKDGQ